MRSLANKILLTSHVFKLQTSFHSEWRVHFIHDAGWNTGQNAVIFCPFWTGYVLKTFSFKMRMLSSNKISYGSLLNTSDQNVPALAENKLYQLLGLLCLVSGSSARDSHAEVLKPIRASKELRTRWFIKFFFFFATNYYFLIKLDCSVSHTIQCPYVLACLYVKITLASNIQVEA